MKTEKQQELVKERIAQAKKSGNRRHLARLLVAKELIERKQSLESRQA